MLVCPSCLENCGSDYGQIAAHLLDMADKSDPDHVMWINRYVSKDRIDQDALKTGLETYFKTDSVRNWIVGKAVTLFYGETPNPYIIAMQNPTKWNLLGYAWEHHHFLKQWVRSCSLIIANTDREDVQRYEIENIISEWYGTDRSPSHHELLLRMAESYGIDRKRIYAGEPLKTTADAIAFWDDVCRNRTFVEGISAMHSLELIPSSRMKSFGASVGYFNPAILSNGSISQESVNFLREGYEADAGHSEAALTLVDRYAASMDMVQACQAVSLKSLEKFYDYLMARLQRGEMLENEQH